MMPQSRLKNRSRSHWEALDLGNKIYINQAKRLSLLWFALSFPVFLLISFLKRISNPKIKHSLPFDSKRPLKTDVVQYPSLANWFGGVDCFSSKV